MPARPHRVARLAEAMTWPLGAERERLEAAVRLRVAPILGSLLVEVARLKALMLGLTRLEPPLELNDPALLPEVGPDPAAIARFRPGRRVAVSGLGKRRCEAHTDPVESLAQLTLGLHVLELERTLVELVALSHDYTFDQEAQLESLLEALPGPLLDALERAQPQWERTMHERHARAQQIASFLAAEPASPPTAPRRMAAELRRGLGCLVELALAADRAAEGSAEARAARLVEPLRELARLLEKPPATATPGGAT